MGRKLSRAQLAARGTSADVRHETGARRDGDGTRDGSPAKGSGRGAGRGRRLSGSSGRPKLHGVITEARVEEQVERSGSYPFTFTSSFILFVAAFAGFVLVPYAAGHFGADTRVASVVGISVLLPPALALTRYFLDSKRGICRGFWLTLGVSFAVCLLVSGLLFIGGVSLL